MPYDIAGALQNPNIIGNALAYGRLGRADGLAAQEAQKTNALASLAGQAYTAAPEQRNALIGQAVGIDPEAGMKLDTQLQANEVDHMKRLGGAARYMADALRSKNQAQIEGAWQNARPYLAKLTGKEPPQHWDPAMEPALYQAIAATGGTPEAKGVVINGSLINSATGETMARVPYPLQYHDVPTGEGKVAGAFDPSIGTVRPAVGGAAQGGPQIDPMQPFIDQANAAIKMGAPQDQVESWLQQQAQQIGVQPQVPGQPGQGGNQLQTTQAVVPAQFGVGTPKPSGGSFRTATPDEVAQMGLPEGTVAQVGSNGKISVVNKPGQDSSEVIAPGDPTLTGDAYLQTIPAGMRATVRAIANGDQAPPSSSSRSPTAQALLQAVYTYDPSASATNLPSRTATRKSFTSGKDAQNMTALSQLALHLDHLNNQVDTVSGSAYLPNGLFNSVQDRYNGNTTAFDSSANAVAHELRSVFANASGGTQAELEENLKQLSSSNSVAQKRAAVRNIAQLVHGRFGILQDKYSQGMGKTQDPFESKYPGAEETIIRLTGGSDGTTQQAAPQAGGVDDLLSKYGVH